MFIVCEGMLICAIVWAIIQVFYKMFEVFRLKEIARSNEDSENNLTFALFRVSFLYNTFFFEMNENIWYVLIKITKSLDRIIM